MHAKKDRRLLVLILISTAMIVAGILSITLFSNRISQMIKRCTAETEGYVTKVYMDTSTDSDGNSETSYETTVEYKIGDETYTRKKDLSKRKEVGDVYVVKYNPDNTNEVYIENFDMSPKSTKYVGIICIVMGCLFLVIMLPTLKKKSRSEPEQEE